MIRTLLAVGLLALSLLAACDAVDDGPGARVTARSPTPTLVRSAPVAAATPAVVSQPAAPSPGTLQGTPTITPTPSATPTVTRTPTRSATPPVRRAASGYRRYASTLHPYAIDYLETWRVTAGGAHFDSGQADLFAGERRGAVMNTVTVFVQPVAAGLSTQLLLEASLAELSEANLTPSEEIARTIDGHDAFVFSYTLTRSDLTYAVTQAIFLRQNQGWVITLTVAPEDHDRLLPVFSHMLDSFQGW